MNRILVIAGVTFREAARKRVLWMALAAGLAFLALFAFALHFQMQQFAERHLNLLVQRQASNTMLMVGLYAVDSLVVVMTILASVDTVSGEIGSGTIQAIATKPIRRSELLLGKFFGFLSMLTLYIALMVGGMNILGLAVTGFGIRHFVQGFSLIWLESLLLLCVSLCFGTFLTTLTNGVLLLSLHGLAFVGGWIEQAGALTQTPKAVNAGVLASLIMPSEALWRRAAFEMQSPLVTGANLSPFSGASVPSPLMIWYSVCFSVAFLCLAVYRFERRDL
jgi:ABC-type transport system involved in multi-copper enzyme maturation permease subunit